LTLLAILGILMPFQPQAFLYLRNVEEKKLKLGVSYKAGRYLFLLETLKAPPLCGIFPFKENPVICGLLRKLMDETDNLDHAFQESTAGKSRRFGTKF